MVGHNRKDIDISPVTDPIAGEVVVVSQGTCFGIYLSKWIVFEGSRTRTLGEIY